MFEVKIETEGLSDSEDLKVHMAAQKMEMVFNSDKFKDFVLNYSHTVYVSTGRLWWRRETKSVRPFFDSSAGLSKYQIYTALMSGIELLDPSDDHEADIFLKVDRNNRRNVVGYTYDTTKWQWIYQWALKQYSVDGVAGNLAHEYCHKIGFNHAFKNTLTRQYSVPYAVGYYVSNFK